MGEGRDDELPPVASGQPEDGAPDEPGEDPLHGFGIEAVEEDPPAEPETETPEDEPRESSSARARMPLWLSGVLLALVMLRVGYHSAYLVEMPFSLATFSDGRLYEQAALDILEAPPWGTEPFYLQGLYAYQLALPMTIRPWISLGLLLQLVLAGLALWWLFRATAPLGGRTTAGLGLALLMLYPGLSFYENKYLTASLAVVTMVAMLWALSSLQRRPRPAAAVWLGVATGLAVLARGNMLLAVPMVAVAAVLAWGRRPRWPALAWLGLGFALAVAPMAVRNATVTGQATIMPAHGGGTSFYIGNNRHARGVWNTAGGLLSGEVMHEQRELAARLGVPDGPQAQQAAAIGEVLYDRAFDEMAEDPGRWLWLELRKTWLMIGNDELTQDYDMAGELERIPWWAGRGVPLSVLLGVGLVGVLVVVRRGRADPAERDRWRPWLWLAGGQTLAVVAANLLFFTSAQHRVPLVVPLAVFLGVGLRWLVQRPPPGPGRRTYWLSWALVALVVVQGIWPRQRTVGPTGVHYYNLAIAHLRLGQPRQAATAFDRAVQLRPNHPVIAIERVTLNRHLGRFDTAAEGLLRIKAMDDVPPWVRTRAAEEARRIEALRPRTEAPP